MVKLTVLYGHPEDPEAFEEYYANTHLPLAAKIPDVQRFEVAQRPSPSSCSSASGPVPVSSLRRVPTTRRS